jgi:hypothetical protein
MPKSKPQNTPKDPRVAYVPGDPPPSIATIPRPPLGFDPKTLPNLRGVKPRASELNHLPDALEELRAFDDYAQVFGRTAPTYDALLKTLERAEGWSVMRLALAQWDAFCSVQEGLAWRFARRDLARLRPAFELAEESDTMLAQTHPKLAALTSAMKVIIGKAVATKKANKQAVAEGREPLRGKKLKAARRAAEREALVEETKKKAAAKKK